MTSPRPTDRATWAGRCRTVSSGVPTRSCNLEQEFGNAAGGLVMAAAVCGGLAAFFEILKPIVRACLMNLCLANNKAAVGWWLMRANRR
jgi:hypothetical protein